MPQPWNPIYSDGLRLWGTHYSIIWSVFPEKVKMARVGLEETPHCEFRGFTIGTLPEMMSVPCSMVHQAGEKMRACMKVIILLFDAERFTVPIYTR